MGHCCQACVSVCVSVYVCGVCVCAGLIIPTKVCPEFSEDLSLPTCMQGSSADEPLCPHHHHHSREISGTAAQPSHPSGFCCIPVSHSPNKPWQERKGSRGGERGGMMQTWTASFSCWSLSTAPCRSTGSLPPGYLWRKSDLFVPGLPVWLWARPLLSLDLWKIDPEGVRCWMH